MVPPPPKIRVMPFAHSEMDPNADRILYLMLLAASFVLVIACANVEIGRAHV